MDEFGPVRNSTLNMGDLDNNQLQPIILCDVTNDTVAPLDADDMVNHNNNNRVHTMNNRD